MEKLKDFPLDQVQITDPYQQNLFEKDVAYLITTLDSDRLLAGFKAMSQRVNPTNLYGGWENTNIRGHSMGHWLSAVAHTPINKPRAATQPWQVRSRPRSTT